MSSIPIADLRREYKLKTLSEEGSPDNPFFLFDLWWQEATDSNIDEVNAMTLATVNETRPEVRTVLLKGYDQNGFVFFTNYESAKGQQLRKNSQASLLFFWKELERQVRINGVAIPLSDEENDTYFSSRPKESQIGAWASPQSSIIPDRQILNDNVERYNQAFGSRIPRPPHWGGYRVVPDAIEFWQGRTSRLHDRLLYLLASDGSCWILSRLAP
jgi:pyridoxamine 5'-phosphate oxidase